MATKFLWSHLFAESCISDRMQLWSISRADHRRARSDGRHKNVSVSAIASPRDHRCQHPFILAMSGCFLACRERKDAAEIAFEAQHNAAVLAAVGRHHDAADERPDMGNAGSSDELPAPVREDWTPGRTGSVDLTISPYTWSHGRDR